MHFIVLLLPPQCLCPKGFIPSHFFFSLFWDNFPLTSSCNYQLYMGNSQIYPRLDISPIYQFSHLFFCTWLFHRLIEFNSVLCFMLTLSDPHWKPVHYLGLLPATSFSALWSVLNVLALNTSPAGGPVPLSLWADHKHIHICISRSSSMPSA